MRFRANRHRAGYPAENKGDCCEQSRVLRGKGGFSLIEVMISASILAVGLLGIAAIFPVAYLNVDSGGKQTEASALSQSFIEELRTLAVIDPANFDAVVGNSILREVISSDFLGPFTGANLRAALGGDFAGLFLLFQLQ